MEESWEGHCALSVEMRGWSLASVLVGWRRARAWTEVMEGRERRIERMCEPTRPVEPTTAVEVIFVEFERDRTFFVVYCVYVFPSKQSLGLDLISNFLSYLVLVNNNRMLSVFCFALWRRPRSRGPLATSFRASPFCRDNLNQKLFISCLNISKNVASILSFGDRPIELVFGSISKHHLPFPLTSLSPFAWTPMPTLSSIAILSRVLGTSFLGICLFGYLWVCRRDVQWIAIVAISSSILFILRPRLVWVKGCIFLPCCSIVCAAF